MRLTHGMTMTGDRRKRRQPVEIAGSWPTVTFLPARQISIRGEAGWPVGLASKPRFGSLFDRLFPKGTSYPKSSTRLVGTLVARIKKIWSNFILSGGQGFS
jgi:hypothetical protein